MSRLGIASVVVVLVAAAACGSRAETPATASPTSAATTAAPTSSAVPTATANPTPSPSPTAPRTYTSLALAYRVNLPDSWRRSTCQSTAQPVEDTVDTFTNASVEEESGTDTGPTQDVVVLSTEINRAGMTALAWLESGKMGFSAASHFEAATVDGKEAARVVPNDGSPSLAFAVASRGRIYALQAGARNASAQSAALTILSSFHIFSDAELFDARLSLPTPSPAVPRSAQQVADALSRGFAQKDVDLLATVMNECLTTGLEQAGASFRSAARYARDLRASFTNGLIVVLSSQQIDVQGDRADLRGTWTDPGQPTRSARFMLRKVADRWYWDGVILAQP